MAYMGASPGDLTEPLTAREQEILTCLAEGLSNQEIANRLHLAEKTVRWYNSQIYSKRGMKNRREAVEQAQALGLLDTPVAAVKHNLPLQATAFVGRQQELDELVALLAKTNTRLLTILAPGGMGKTRLALAVAERQLPDYQDGVYFVPLAPLTSPDNIVTAIAESVGFSFSGGVPPKQQLLAFLRARTKPLVLDNFEHLLEAAGLVAEIVQTAPQVMVLVTSRERLNLRSETLYSLSGLRFPNWETTEDALEYDAVQLFMQSSRQVRPDFELQTNDLDVLARICRLTEGMPLGIELAAGWVDILSLEQIAAELQQGIDILETELRDVPQRQRSVRATFNYTWARLDDSDREVFVKLSVFRGGFTAKAAQAIADTNPRHLRKLVDKALVQGSVDERYDIHELLRQYGASQLELAGQGNTLRDAHAHYFGVLLHARRSDQHGPGKADLLAIFTAEVDNIRASWSWAVQRGHYVVVDQLIELLWMYYTDYSEAFELGAMCQAAREVLSSIKGRRERAVLGRVLARQGKWVATLGHYEQAEALLRESMAIAQEQNNLDEYYYALRWLAWWILMRTGENPVEIHQMLEECVAFYRERGDKAQLALTLSNLAELARSRGNIEQRRACLIEKHQLYRDMGYMKGLAEAVGSHARLAGDEGDWTEAERLLKEAVAILIQIGNQRQLMIVQANWSFVTLIQGDPLRARQLCEATLRLRQTSEERMTLTDYIATEMSWMCQSLIADAAGEVGDALDLLEALRKLAHYGSNDLWRAELIYAWVLCSLGQVDAASETLRGVISPRDNAALPKSDRLFAIAVAARLLAHRGDHAPATELLGLVYTHPNGPRGYLEQHQGMTQFRDDLEAELGAEVFAAAWKRGEKFDLRTVVEELTVAFA